MKKLLLIILNLMLLPMLLQAQDRMLLLNGNELQVKVLELTPDSVRFTVADSAGIQVTAKQEVFMITYQNGTKELIKPMADQPVSPATGYSEMEMYNLGRRQAKQYFKAGGAYWGTLGSTMGGMLIAGPLPGLGAGIAIATSGPAPKNIVTPNPEFLQSPAYLEGYRNQAKSKKRANALGGFATGVGVTFLVIVAAFANAY